MTAHYPGCTGDGYTCTCPPDTSALQNALCQSKPGLPLEWPSLLFGSSETTPAATEAGATFTPPPGPPTLHDRARRCASLPETKPTNPKDMIGSTKLPLNLVPDTLVISAAMAFAEGASKYGAYNWRAAGVRTSIYVAALRRHLDKFWNGETTDPVTRVPHLASVIACAGIILDAELAGKLNDDRPPAVALGKLIALAEEVTRGVYAQNAERNPHHWTISDEVPA